MQPLARSGTSIDTSFDTPESRSQVVGFLVAILMLVIYFYSNQQFENISWSPSRWKATTQIIITDAEKLNDKFLYLSRLWFLFWIIFH